MILNAKLKKTSPFFRAIDAEGTEERERGRERMDGAGKVWIRIWADRGCGL